MAPEAFEVRQVRRETGDTFTLTLAAPGGLEPRSFAPGQFNMLYVFGVGEVPISVSGDPGRPELLVHTIRAVGATTRALQKLKAGDQVGLRGPFGTHWPLDQAHKQDMVLVAEGGPLVLTESPRELVQGWSLRTT
jgi:NAD(P)H-flavin reductase